MLCYMQEQSKTHPRFITLPSSKVRPANPVILEGVDDLIQLSYLNEPSVLHNLRHRYVRNKIYVRISWCNVIVYLLKSI
jgi:myosin-5